MTDIWSEPERAAYRRQMARRRDSAIAELPNGRFVYESDLDVTPRERTGMVIAYAILAAAIFGVICAALGAGGLLIAVFGL